MFARITVGIVMLLCVVGVVSHLVPSPIGPEIAFADVQKQMEKVKTIVFTNINFDEYGHQRDGCRIMILGRDLMRIEGTDGEYVYIADRKNNKRIHWFVGQKKAYLWQGVAVEEIPPYYDRFRTRYGNVEADAVKRLPDREINGAKAIGFLVAEGEKVWVDPKTRLPIRIELLAGLPVESPRLSSVTADIVFDSELDESLFRLVPPPGYTLQIQGVAELPPVPAVESLAAPEVTPLVGIGPAQFGMSKEEVIRVLGAPDSVGPDGDVLNYNSRGFELEVSHDSGLTRIECFAQEDKDIIVRDFRGKTTEDIGMGAGVEQIVKAYGRPDYREECYPDGDLTDSNAYLAYGKLRIKFWLSGDKLVRMEARAENVHWHPQN